MQGEIFRVQAQLALAQVAADAAADVFRRGRAQVGGKADAFEVGGELQARIALDPGPVVELDIAQRAHGLELRQHGQGLIRQRRQRRHQGLQGGQLQTVGTEQPLLLHGRAVLLLG